MQALSTSCLFWELHGTRLASWSSVGIESWQNVDSTNFVCISDPNPFLHLFLLGEGNILTCSVSKADMLNGGGREGLRLRCLPLRSGPGSLTVV